MKKGIIYLSVINFVILVAIVSAAFYKFPSNENLAFVNTGELLEGFEGMTEAKAEYKKKADIWQANIDTLESELMSELKKYEKERAGMTAKEKELSEQLLNNKQQQFLQYQQAIKKKAKEEDQKTMAVVINQVNSFIKEYGTQHNYNIIFGTTQGGNIVYAVDALNITDDVLKSLNEKHKGE